MLACILAELGAAAAGGTSAAALIVGLAVLDFGVQGQMVLSQGAIYELGTENASRVTTAYITSCFAGGTVGSAAAAAAWSLGGWTAVRLTGAAIAAVALVAWAAVTPAREALPRRRGTAPG